MASSIVKPTLNLELYPKQIELGRHIEHGKASWIGYGGSRGGGKSGSLRRLMLARRFSHPGTWGIIIRRVFDELKRNHIDELFREYPVLQQYYKVSDKELTLPGTNGSKIFFGYAETLDEVKRKFMGGQYMDVFIDQAEQFTEEELREIKQAARWPDTSVGACKCVMFFNMGGVGIQYFKRVFHTKDFKGKERAEDYAFVHAHAWDNVTWVMASLREDGFSINDYYAWTEEQRKAYCAERSDYGRNLTSQDESLIARDWDGSWESLEGAYFGSVWDRDKAVISQQQINELVEPWWTRWMSLDWGRDHYAVNYWHVRGLLKPEKALSVLGWAIDKPLDVTITYREHVAREASELDYAAQVINLTSANELRHLKSYFAGTDIFGERSSQNTIAQQIDSILKPAGFPLCEPADTRPGSRISGASLMYNLLLETKRMGRSGEECWLIGSGCPALIEAIPVLMRDPKKLEDVLKVNSNKTPTDDAFDSARYGLQTGRQARKVAPVEVRYEEQVNSIPDYTARHIASLRFKELESKKGVRRGWRN